MHGRRPSAGTLIACLALFFAIGGSAVAASHYLVTSKSQISPKVLKALRGNAGPSGPAGAGGSQGAAGAQGAQGPQGTAGQKGATGPQGVTGPTAVNELVEVVSGPAEFEFFKEEVEGEEIKGYEAFAFAECPPGDSVVSGGSEIVGFPSVTISAALSNGGWAVVGFSEEEQEEEAFVRAVAYCAPEGEAVAPLTAGRRARAKSALRSRARADAARMERHKKH